jgi:FAD/FMN-containing dehydrogenase
MKINLRTEERNRTGDSARASQAASELRSSVKGQVITPSDTQYDQARTIFVGGLDLRPALIVRPVDAADVAAIIRTASNTGLEISVRSGGHSAAGHSLTDGGVVIDLRELKALDLDPESRTAWAETGLTAGEYINESVEYGLATPFGDTGTVGIGGITLGGGIGYLSRKFGMTIDNLLAAELVTAGGQILLVDAEHHPDLFWAIRGGGGNFGVATRFQYRLRDVSKMVGGMLILPATAESIVSFVSEVHAAPDELSAIINVMPAPPMPFLAPEDHGKLIIFALMAYTGDIEAGERAFAPFRAIAKPLADMVRPIRYTEMFFPEDESYHPTPVTHNMHVNTIDRQSARSILEHLENSTAPMRAAQIRVLGGEIARIPTGATAYAHRQAPIMVQLAAFYNGPEDRPVQQAWLEDLARSIDQGVPGVYSNFMGEEGHARLLEAYPETTWKRLADVKARYDPTNLFHRNHNIPPSQ